MHFLLARGRGDGSHQELIYACEMEIDHITRLQRYECAVQLHEHYERDDKARVYNKLEKLWGKCDIAKRKGYAKNPV